MLEVGDDASYKVVKNLTDLLSRMSDKFEKKSCKSFIRNHV
jgi:hypothetical protein